MTAKDTPVERLQSAWTVVQRPESCEREASQFSPASEVCAIEEPARQTGACNGDSGGASISTRSTLSPREPRAAVPSRWGPLQVTLSGRGVAHRVITLEPGGG